jgi:peroxiredoxin
MIKAGDVAPDFILPAHDGCTLALANLRGHKVLLWFFPEAGTPGCTLEGRGFRDHQEYFDESNIRVVGVSFNTPEENAEFAKSYMPHAQTSRLRTPGARSPSARSASSSAWAGAISPRPSARR